MDFFTISYSYISADVTSDFMARFPEFIFLILVHSQSLLSTFSFSTSQGKRDLVLEGEAVSRVQTH